MDIKDKVIDDFLKRLAKETKSDLTPIQELHSKFDIRCKKCGSHRIFGQLDEEKDFDPYGHSGEFIMVVKCADCGNAMSISKFYCHSGSDSCRCND